MSQSPFHPSGRIPSDPIDAEIVASAKSRDPPNPYLVPPVPPPEFRPPSAFDEYQKVADVAGGVNLRWRDNLYQGIAILIATLLGAVIGPIVALVLQSHPVLGAIFGGFAGLVLGFFVSGIFLMIYRLFRH